MQGLCTLDLRETDITHLPNSLSDLKSLKALLLKDCRKLKDVPYLGNMKALRELNLSHTAIKAVPKGVEELLNLRFLSLDGADELKVLPRGLLRKLGSLQHVRLPCHLEASIEEIVNLKKVEEFRGAVKSVGDFNCFIKSDRVHDTFYLLQVGPVYYNILKHISREEFYNKVLVLSECSLADEKVSGEDIEFLHMWGCEGFSKCLLDDIINPTSLRKLKIEYCGGTEFILRLMSAQETSFQLSSLEKIHLFDLDDFKGVIDTPTPAPPQCVFRSLKSLHIENCYKMRKLGLPVSGFPKLEEISIERCFGIEEIFEDEGRGESVTLPKLTSLSLDVLPRLERVCRTTMICNSIKEINIEHCPRLMKKLPVHLDVPPPPYLREISVEREWWESLEWDNPNLPPLLQPLLTLLE